MAKERSCRSCVYWGKPAGRKALSGLVFACTAPLPVLLLPESVTKANGFTLQLERRAYMERDEGKRCPTWADTIPPAPKP